MKTIKFSFGSLSLTNEVINRLEDLGYTPESLKEEIKKHKQTNGSESPALYCSTYGKYNSGNPRGMWVNLSTFNDYEDFKNFCLAIHADEADPKLMYQDYENMPHSLYHESIGEEEFNKIAEYCELCDEYNASAVDDFLEFYSPEDLDRMHDAYVGVYDSEEDFALEIVGDCYDLDILMGDFYFGSHGTVLRTF